MKKRIALIFTVLLFSVLGFSACGDPYKKMSFSLTSEKDLTQTVELYLSKSDQNLTEYDINDSFVVKAQVGGVGKNISKDVVVPEFDEKVDIETTVTDVSTYITITAKSEGETLIRISPKDNPDGKFTRYIKVKVSIGLANFAFKDNAIPAMAMGSSLNLNSDVRKYISFTPEGTSQTDIQFYIKYPSDKHDYAKIEGGVLYTYDSENYPEKDGVKVVTLVAKSLCRPDLNNEADDTKEYDIPIIKIDNQINVSTTYNNADITLDKNSNGKYEIILADAGISAGGGSANDTSLTERILHIGVGTENSATSNYRISIDGDYSGVGNAVTFLPYPSEDDSKINFLVKANFATNGIDIRLKIDYFGNNKDNPSNDESLYKDKFTQFITFTVKVYSLPNENNLEINGSKADNQKYVVYDAYYKSTESNINENGTLFRVNLSDTTIPNIVAKITYHGDGFDQSGLIFVGGTKIDNGITIANGESFYLKHSYTQEQIQQIPSSASPYIEVNITYSFAPSNATADQKEMYYSKTISKKIYLDFKAGIKEIKLNDSIGLEITSTEWNELFVFPEGYVASDTVDQILGRNLDLIQVKYEDNKILIKANEQFNTGEAKLRVIATNGLSSNTASIMVYLPVLYSKDNLLLVKVDKESDALFVAGKMTEDGYEEVDAKGEYEDYEYSTYTHLILASNSSLTLDVYSIMEESGFLKAVLPNVNITFEAYDADMLAWTTTQSADGVLSGKLSTFAKTGETTITFTLKGYTSKTDGDTNFKEVTILHKINVWVYDTITSVDFSKKLNTIYLQNSLGIYEQDESKYQYEWNILPTNGDYGNFNKEISLKNDTQTCHSINLNNNELKNLVRSLFDLENIDGYNISIKDQEGYERLNGNTFSILNKDLLSKVENGKEDDNVGYEAKINDQQFTVTITSQNSEDNKEDNKSVSLISLFEKMFGSVSESYKHQSALSYIFNGNTSNNNKESSYRDFVLSGTVSQFGRSVYVETVVRVCKPVKVSSINVSVSKEGLYFEREVGATEESLASQSFTYNVSPNNAHNTDIMLKIYDGNDTEQNIVVTTTKYFTLSADQMVIINDTQYKFNDNKLYAYNEISKEYDIEKTFKCGLLNSATIWVEMEENSYNGKTIAYATINNGKITITIASGVSGNYRLKLIAKDSVTQGDGEKLKYGVTQDVRIEIGDGNSESPFQLRSIDSLIRMWKRNINGQNEYYYKLNNNINVQGQNFAEYIFNSKNVFMGDFDGNGKSIIGLTATTSVTNTSVTDTSVTGGLFAKYSPTDNKKIYDLTLSGINYNITINTNDKYTLNVGGIAGSTNGTIENVYVSGNINVDYGKDIAENEASTMYVGGLIGTMSGGTLTGTAKSSSFADDMTANVAILYNGNSNNNGSHYFGGAIGQVSGTSTINNVKVSSSIKAVSGKDSDTYTKATLGGLVGLVNESLTVKDARITPTLSGYENIGGVVGNSSATLDINHVVVEFIYNSNVKNYIMGRNNVGGFVGNTTAKTLLLNSYIRSFVKENIEETYSTGKYCGNIIVRGGQLASVNAGGFVGNTIDEVMIERSYVMGDIKSYVGSDKTENVGGFIGSYNSEKNIKIVDAYYDGKILTNKAIPNVLFGTDTTPTPTSSSTIVDNITTETIENTMTENKNVGEYIKIVATKTEGVSYEDYTYDYEKYTYNDKKTISISNFYASVNGSHHVWTEKNKNSYTLRTPKNVVKSTLYLTFARMSDEYIAYTGYKIVEDSNSGTKTKYDLFGTRSSGWFEKQTNYVDTDKADVFKDLLGFDGRVATPIGENTEKFVLNAGSFENPTDYEISTLLSEVSNESEVESSVNKILSDCSHNEGKLDESFDITDLSNLKVGDLYGVEYKVKNKREVYNITVDNAPFKAYKEITTETVSKIEFIISDTVIELYCTSGGLYKTYNDGNLSNKFTNIVAIVGEKWVAFYETETQDEYLGSDDITYYVEDDILYYYADSNKKPVGGQLCSVTFDLENCLYKVCDLYYNSELMFSKVNLSDDEKSIVFDGKSYEISVNNVTLASTNEIMAKVYGFSYTNGNVAKDEEDEYKVDGSGYVIDTDGSIIAKYTEGKFVFDENNASWILSDDVNSGMPALIRKLESSESVDTLDVLYDAVASMNVKVTEFNYSGSSNLNPYKQGYIMLDESSVILFYNTPSDKYTAQNTYVLASSDEKAELDRKNIGGQVPVVVDFSNVSLNKPFELTSVKDYSIKSSNPNILSVGKYNEYTSLNTLGTGYVTLTFTNRYDDTNTFSISVYIVAGVSGIKEMGTMFTYVQKTSTYSFGFDNTLSNESSSYVMDANVGGYTLKVEPFDGDQSLTFNGVELNKNSNETYEFDMSNSIVIYGKKAGTLNVVLTPFVKYGNNQKYTLDYLSKTVTITIEDIAKSISTGSNTATTIKPESTVKFDVEIISSKSDEKIITYITDRDGNTYTYDDNGNNLFALADIYVLKTSTSALENNLHKITYTVYVELNDTAYYEYYIDNNFKNPLEDKLSYSFEFVPNSWISNNTIMTEFKDKTAKYSVNIEGNAVSNIITSFYNTKLPDKQNKNTIEEERIYEIDSNAAYVNKLAPGNIGLLRLKVSKDYNNLSYLAVRTTNNSVTLLQANATTDATQKFSYLSIANTPTDNGIKLWNMIYYTDDNVDMNYANYYYVFVMFDEKITSGSFVDLQVTAYGKGDVELIPTVTVSVEVDYLPQIKIVDAYGDSSVSHPVGEYRRIYINTSHVENSLKWSVDVKKDDEDVKNVLYGFVKEGETYVYKEIKNPDQNKYPYICYNNMGVYEKLPNNFTLDMISGVELYIYIPADTYLGDFVFSVSGYRIINAVPTYKSGRFDLSTMLFDIENIAIDGAVGGVVTLPVGYYTTFDTIFTLNSYAQGLYEDYKNGEYDKYKNSSNENDIKSFAFAKYLFDKVEDLRKLGAGAKIDETTNGYNGWNYVSEKNVTEQMKNGAYYPDDSPNFLFFYESVEDTYKYGVTALKISRNTIEYKLDLKLENGIYALDNTGTRSEIYKPITFTLQITDNSTADHPIPIYDVTDFIKMCESVSEEQVSQEVSNNSDVDPTELVFGNYILLDDLTLESWVPRDINVSSFDGNGFTITIKSWNFNSIIDNSTASAGLFTKIGEYTVIKNLNIDIAPLLSDDTTSKNAKTKFVDSNGDAVQEVTFGVVAAENEGVISNVKVVATYNEKGKNLHIWTQQGYSNGTLCSATIAGFVALNSGAISDCFVGLNAVVDESNEFSYIKRTESKTNINQSKDQLVYPFTLVGGNRLAGFVHQNSGTISNSYVMGVSIKNQTERSSNSMTAGFVNENANSGNIYSCFVSGSEYSGYGEDIVDLRATKTEIYSKGNVGGFVYENQGTIENAYSIINIIVQTVNSAGFAYSNISDGVIKNAYTTSTTSNINSLAHGMFVYLNTATLQNTYYLLLEGERGITPTNKPDDVLKAIDPANAIVSRKPSDVKDKKDIISFANAGSFEGFTFASDLTSYDGIWYLGGKNKKYYPQLVNTINYNITSVRTFTGSESTEDSSTSGTESEESGLTAGNNLIYNYTYRGNPNYGSEKNPIVISQPAQFAQYIVANTKKVTNTDGESIYVFGGVEAVSDTTYAPAYVRIINNISLAKINLSNTYSCNDESKIPLSKVVFDGYLIGNGMTISDITLNNTSTSGNNLEDFGLFKQIGLSATQKTSYYSDAQQKTLIDPVVYNIKFSYNELSDRDANKVGLLAGSVYGGSIMNITIEGEKDDVENTVSTITGHNLVGAVAGLIQGDITLTDITIKNVRVNATRNTIDSLSDSYNDSGSYYERFVFGQNTTEYKKIEFEDNTISNLSQISYAGGVAGVIIADNLSKAGSQINSLSDMSTYALDDYQNVGVKIHDIVVKDNVEISGDMAGGLFGYAKNTHIRSSAFLLMQGANNTTSYQRIFGRAFGGGLIGQTDGVVLERTNIYHADEDYQNTIDTTIAQITSDSVSKNDLFLKGDVSTTESVSVAIGGMVGLSKDMIVLDSYSKVNVYNPKSKIAGGMIGYAEGKNGIWYSFAYGNVKAKEVIGGLIGFYRYNSFDLYLNNAFALNVWSSDVKDTLKTNLTAVYGSRYDYTLRMPEIGNQMSEYSDGIIKLTGKTNSVVSDGNSTFTYIGSVLGKATLNNGVYKSGESTILTIEDGKLENGDTAVKNLFIRGDEGNEIINSDDTGVTAVRLFTSTTTTNGYAINIDPVKVEEIVYNKVGIFSEGEQKGQVEYYTYIGDQFYNVYSSLCGVTTRTGSASENNLVSNFNGLTPNNSDVDIVDLTNLTEVDTNAVRYSTIFGTQYAISQITGYFQESGNANGVDYRNLFNDPAFTHVFSEEDVDVLKTLQKKDDKGNVTTYSDYVTATNANASTQNLSSWYFDESTGLLRYRVGSEGSVTKIETHKQLIKVLDSNTKGKSYTLNMSNDSSSAISSDSNGNARFTKTFSGTIIGEQAEETERQVVNMTLTGPVFEMLDGAYLSNIEFKINFDGWSDANAGNYANGSWGLFAQYLYNTTFENCKFTFTNVPTAISTFKGANNTSYAGLLFGSMINSTLTKCELSIVKDANSGNTITVKNTALGFGVVAGSMSGGSINNLIVNVDYGEIIVNNGMFTSEAINTGKANRQSNVGGLIGTVTGASISDVNSTTKNIPLKVGGAVTGDSTIGGLFGSVSSSSRISNCNYYNNMDVEVVVVSGTTSTALSIGGVIGKLTNSTVSNCYFNGSMDSEGAYTDNSKDKAYNVKLNNNGGGKSDEYIGGIIGQISGYVNSNNVMINRVPINVTISGGTADDKIYVGGIFGADTNSSGTHSKMFVTGDITVKTSDTQDYLYVGGVMGKSQSVIEDSYMQGDITVDGGTIYAGGIVGAISDNVLFNKCVMYGDIRYTLGTNSYYLAGIVGGRIASSSNDNSKYKFTNCTVLASIYEVKYNSGSENDKYDMVSGNTTGNKYSSSKYAKLYISPFISGIDVNKVTIDNTDFYIIEDYFDFYYDKESKSDEVEKNQSTYGTSTIGKYYYDIYNNLVAHKDTKTALLESDSKFGNATYAFENHYFFGKEYGKGTKYNPKILTSISDDISGYNIITTANKEAKQDASISISDNITINRNAVLACKSTNGVTFTGGKTVTNNGVIENIVFDWDGAIDTNNGVLNNVVAYGVNKSTPSSDMTMYGLVDTNNGFIYRSGAIIVYTGLTKSSNIIEIGGLVHTNNHVIGLSYCSSMLTGLKYDKGGTAYVLDNSGNKTENSLKITSGGIAYTNKGTIEDSLFDGTLYGGNQSEYNIAYTTTGTISDTKSYKGSMYYNEEQNVTADARFYTANNRNYTINFGRPYVNGGIKINTEMGIKLDSTDNTKITDISYFATKGEEIMIPVFNITDFNSMNSSTTSTNSYVLLNDLYVGYENDMYSTAFLSGTFYGNGYSIVSSYNPESTETQETHSKYLFDGSPNIYNLSIRNFSTSANAILGNSFVVEGETKKDIKGIKIYDSLVKLKTYSTNVGLMIGSISNYNINDVVVESSLVSLESCGYCGIIGQTTKSNITSVKNNVDDIFELTGDMVVYFGGIVGCADQDTTISSCTSSTSFNVRGYYGGIVGKVINKTTIEKCTVNANNIGVVDKEISSLGVGGIIARLDTAVDVEISNNMITSTLAGYTAGGIVGEIYSAKNIKMTENTVSNTITGKSYAGGVVGRITNNSVSITLSGGTIGGTIECTNGYAGGIAGKVSSADCFKFEKYEGNNATLTTQVVLRISGYEKTIDDDKSLSHSRQYAFYTANEWYNEIQYNGWGSRKLANDNKQSYRFSSGIPVQHSANEYFGYGGKYGYNIKDNKINFRYRPRGLWTRLYDEDYDYSESSWCYPVANKNVDNRYAPVEDKGASEQAVGNLEHGFRYWFEEGIGNGIKTENNFQSDKLGVDDSLYISNLSNKNNYYASLNDTYKNVTVLSGIIYGAIGSEDNNNQFLSDNIDKDTLKDALDVDGAKIIQSKDQSNTDKTKYLLNRYTQWFYIYFERNRWLEGILYQLSNYGILAIEYDLYVNSDDLVGGTVEQTSTWFKDKMDGDENSKKVAQEHAEMYVAYDIELGGASLDFTSGGGFDNNSWNLTKLYKIQNNYVLSVDLYEKGISQNFFYSVYKSARYSDSHINDKSLENYLDKHSTQ